MTGPEGETRLSRTAFCCCRAASITVQGDPRVNGVCGCENCRRRTGSALGWSVYFDEAQVVAKDGDLGVYRIRDEQERAFCRRCGATLYWRSTAFPGCVGVAGGAFSPLEAPPPRFAAAASGLPAWLGLPPDWPKLG